MGMSPKIMDSLSLLHLTLCISLINAYQFLKEICKMRWIPICPISPCFSILGNCFWELAGQEEVQEHMKLFNFSQLVFYIMRSSKILESKQVPNINCMWPFYFFYYYFQAAKIRSESINLAYCLVKFGLLLCYKWAMLNQHLQLNWYLPSPS